MGITSKGTPFLEKNYLGIAKAVKIQPTDIENITDRIESSIENICRKSSVTGSDPPPPPPPPMKEMNKMFKYMAHMTTHIPYYEGYEEPKWHWFV